MKKIILHIIYILAFMNGLLEKVSIAGYLEYAFSIIRTGRISLSIKAIGKRVFLGKDIKFKGLNNIIIGDNTTLGEYSIITAYKTSDITPNLVIGNSCNLGPYNHITCISDITIGDGVLTGRWVTITDNSHGNNTMEELNVEPIKRKLFSKGGVKIGDNVWIGDKATILPGVTIGSGTIVGANSVVTHNLPENCIACGNPAKIIKNIT